MPEQHELSEGDYRRRSRRSLFTGGAATLTGFLGWQWVQTQPDSDRIPGVLRNGHESQ